MASYRGSSVVITLGVILLVGALSHHAAEATNIATDIGPALSLVLDGGLAIGLIGGGWWLRHTNMTDAEERSVALWTLAGGVVGLGIAGIMLLVRVLEARPLTEPQFSVLVHTASGATGLFLAGTHASRRRGVANRFETLFNNTTQFAGLLQPDGTVVEVNKSALDFGGFDRNDVIGRQFQDVSWWRHSETVHDRVQDALHRVADGETVRYETVVQGADGLRAIDFSARPVTDNRGETTQIVVEGLDITDKKQHRQHLEVLHRVMRHNMRNDLMKLRGWTQNAATASTHEERVAAADRVTDILDSWEKMSTEIKEIQETFHSDPEQIDNTPEEIPLSEVIDAQRTAYPETTFEVTDTTPSDVHVPVSVKKAMTESIDNAVKSTTTETPEISISVERMKNDWLRIEVADNGPGMPEAEAAVLETGEETPLIHGKGMGVWKIRMLTKRIGGDISVDTDTDGTTLCFKLPRESPRQMAAAA
jgi:PAS domain S-box-containing protein